VYQVLFGCMLSAKNKARIIANAGLGRGER
jgi:hypothetical protein